MQVRMAFSRFRVNRKPEEPAAATEIRDSHPSLMYLIPPNLPRKTERQHAQSPTELYLQSLSVSLLHALCNERNFHHPLLARHIAPEFNSSQDDLPGSEDREDHLELAAEALSSMPDYRCVIYDCVARICEGGRKAKVWTSKRLSGLPGGICKDGVSVMAWERRGQVWMCTRLKMMRGVAEYD